MCDQWLKAVNGQIGRAPMSVVMHNGIESKLSFRDKVCKRFADMYQTQNTLFSTTQLFIARA